MSNDKIKILALGDTIAFNTGVGLQARYVLTGLLATGRYDILQLGGAKKHPSYQPFKYNGIVVKPVDGYGNKMELRAAMDEWHPDALWFITDPRFYGWLCEMADEVNARCPMFYWHVWDEEPAPRFNKPLYDSCEHVACISRLTNKMLGDMGCTNHSYLPHALPRDFFKPQPEKKMELRHKAFGQLPDIEKRFMVFWIGVNARRKRLGDFLLAMDKVTAQRPDTLTIVKTMMQSDEGVNPKEFIDTLCPHLKANNNVLFLEHISDHKDGKDIQRDFTEQEIADLYNMSDVVVNNSSHEGFGLSVLQALYCGIPILGHETGGITGQIKDLPEVCRMPSDATAIVGDVVVPYISEHFVNPDTIVKHLMQFMNMTAEERMNIGRLAYEASKEYDMQNMITQWDDIIQRGVTNHRSGYKPWSLITL